MAFLKLQANTAFKQKEYKLASQLYGLVNLFHLTCDGLDSKFSLLMGTNLRAFCFFTSN